MLLISMGGKAKNMFSTYASERESVSLSEHLGPHIVDLLFKWPVICLLEERCHISGSALVSIAYTFSIQREQ